MCAAGSGFVHMLQKNICLFERSFGSGARLLFAAQKNGARRWPYLSIELKRCCEGGKAGWQSARRFQMTAFGPHVGDEQEGPS